VGPDSPQQREQQAESPSSRCAALLEEELRHAEFLEAQYASLLEKGTADSSVELKGEEEGEGRIFSEDLYRRAGEAHFEMYKAEAEQAADPEVVEFFETLAKWESSHYHRLLKEQKALQADYWQGQRLLAVLRRLRMSLAAPRLPRAHPTEWRNLAPMKTTALQLLSLLALTPSCGDDGRTATDAGTRDAGPGQIDSGSRVDSGIGDADGGPAGTDSGRPDAGTEVTDGGSCVCIGETVTWGNEGGFTAWGATSEVSACRTYLYTRMPHGGTATTCTNQVPCQDDAVTTADLAAALEHADVVAAFAAAPVLYGQDGRPFDAPLFRITRAGRTFDVGLPCMGSGGCTPIPPGVAALRTLLVALESARLAAEDCATIFPGG